MLKEFNDVTKRATRDLFSLLKEEISVDMGSGYRPPSEQFLAEVQALLASKPDLNVFESELLDDELAESVSLVHLAARNHLYKVLELFFKSGLQIEMEKRDGYGQTPMACAADFYEIETSENAVLKTCEILLLNNADINIDDNLEYPDCSIRDCVHDAGLGNDLAKKVWQMIERLRPAQDQQKLEPKL